MGAVQPSGWIGASIMVFDPTPSPDGLQSPANKAAVRARSGWEGGWGWSSPQAGSAHPSWYLIPFQRATCKHRTSHHTSKPC